MPANAENVQTQIDAVPRGGTDSAPAHVSSRFRSCWASLPVLIENVSRSHGPADARVRSPTTRRWSRARASCAGGQAGCPCMSGIQARVSEPYQPCGRTPGPMHRAGRARRLHREWRQPGVRGNGDKDNEVMMSTLKPESQMQVLGSAPLANDKPLRVRRSKSSGSSE